MKPDSKSKRRQRSNPNERIFHDGKQNGIKSQFDFESSFPAALSIRHDGCLLKNQEDYEFRRCTFNKVGL